MKMNVERELHIGLAFDENYLVPALVVIKSAIDTLKKDYKLVFHVVYTEKSLRKYAIKYVKDFFADEVEIEFHLVDLANKLKKIDFPSIYNESILYRLLLPELLHRRIDKIIWLDSDILITNDLSELWEIPFEDKYILGAHENNIISAYAGSGFNGYGKVHSDFGLDPDDQVICTGVMVLNLKPLYDFQICDRVIKFIQKYENLLVLPDMTALNFLLHDKIKIIHSKFNAEPDPFMAHYYGAVISDPHRYLNETIEEITSHPTVVHFSKMPKPWMYKAFPEYRHPFFDKWMETAMNLNADDEMYHNLFDAQIDEYRKKTQAYHDLAESVDSNKAFIYLHDPKINVRGDYV